MTYLVSLCLFPFGHVDRKKETKMETNKISSNVQTNIETFKKYTNPMSISTKKSVICSRDFHLNRHCNLDKHQWIFNYLKRRFSLHSTYSSDSLNKTRSDPDKSTAFSLQRSFFLVLSQNLTITDVSWK